MNEWGRQDPTALLLDVIAGRTEACDDVASALTVAEICKGLCVGHAAVDRDWAFSTVWPAGQLARAES